MWLQQWGRAVKQLKAPQRPEQRRLSASSLVRCLRQRKPWRDPHTSEHKDDSLHARSWHSWSAMRTLQLHLRRGAGLGFAGLGQFSGPAAVDLHEDPHIAGVIPRHQGKGMIHQAKARHLKMSPLAGLEIEVRRRQREEEVLAPRLRDQLGLLHLHSLARGLHENLLHHEKHQSYRVDHGDPDRGHSSERPGVAQHVEGHKDEAEEAGEVHDLELIVVHHIGRQNTHDHQHQPNQPSQEVRLRKDLVLHLDDGQDSMDDASDEGQGPQSCVDLPGSFPGHQHDIMGAQLEERERHGEGGADARRDARGFVGIRQQGGGHQSRHHHHHTRQVRWGPLLRARPEVEAPTWPGAAEGHQQPQDSDHEDAGDNPHSAVVQDLEVRGASGGCRRGGCRQRAADVGTAGIHALEVPELLVGVQRKRAAHAGGAEEAVVPPRHAVNPGVPQALVVRSRHGRRAQDLRARAREIEAAVAARSTILPGGQLRHRSPISDAAAPGHRGQRAHRRAAGPAPGGAHLNLRQL
mmetsp:Transcript_125239/g.297226  ORF Transcript_125239/g.297226 Transcript_125239/m.297226 type:complete len:520 (-) Transcript_125239:89-1648(-)